MSLPRAEALTHTEVEAIVRAVLQRLRSSAPGGGASSHSQGDVRAEGGSPAGVPLRAAEAVERSTVVGVLRLDRRVVALEHLRDQWNGLRLLQVPAGCVVTPAVQDELRQRGVALERFTAASAAASGAGATLPARLWVLAPGNQQAGLTRQLAGDEIKFQRLEGDAAASDLSDLRQHLADGDRYALWCTPRPFAAMAQIASQLKTTAIQLPVLEDLPRAVEQAQPKLIVVDAARWHAAAISQLVRNWTRSFITP